ncbi:MAG: RagB/SusD family nutrient uptake outer membrane protein, partial [Bacteroidota bacterium]
LNERLYELMYEAKRRQDLIRYGLYEDAWEFKEASSAIRVLFPIPQQQLNANPNLVQNSGY